MKRKELLLFHFIFLGLNHVLAEDSLHIVKIGETLSGILNEKNLKPIYGNRGSLKLIQKLNPQLSKNKGNKIYPGQEIILIRSDLEIEVPVAAESVKLPIAVPEVFRRENQEMVDKKMVSYSDLNLSVTSRFIKVESTDNRNNGQATLLSDSSVGYNFSWGQSWSDKFHTNLEFEKYQVHILEASSTTSSLMNTTQSLSNYLFGGVYEITPKVKFSSSINHGETIVSRAENPSTIVIEKFISTKFNNGVIYTILSQDDLKLNSLAELIVALPSTQETYSSKLSYGYNLGLSLEDKLSIFRIKGGVFYKSLDFKMSEANFKHTEVGMIIGLIKNFGEGN
jgi:hypothetical protein